MTKRYFMKAPKTRKYRSIQHSQAFCLIIGLGIQILPGASVIAATPASPVAVSPTNRTELKESVITSRRKVDTELARRVSARQADTNSKERVMEAAKQLASACDSFLGSPVGGEDIEVARQEGFAYGALAGLGDLKLTARLHTIAWSMSNLGKVPDKPSAPVVKAADVKAALSGGLVDGLLAVEPFWGTNETLFTGMMTTANRVPVDPGAKLAHKLIASTNAPEFVVTKAQALLRRRWGLGSTPQLAAVAIDGRRVNLGQFRGKVVLLDFWATDCAPCIAELPEIKEVYLKLKADGFEVIGISLDRDKESVLKMIKKKGVPWPVLFDERGFDGPTAGDFAIQWVPQNWVVDRDGKVLGFADRADALEDVIEAVLAENRSK